MAPPKEKVNISEAIRLEGFMADQFRVTEGEAPVIPVGERFELMSPENISRVLETYQHEPSDYFYFRVYTRGGDIFLASDGETTKFVDNETDAVDFSKIEKRVEAFYKMKEIRDAEEAAKRPAQTGDIAGLQAKIAELAKENEELKTDMKTAVELIDTEKKENSKLRGDLTKAINALEKATAAAEKAPPSDTKEKE